MKSQNQGEDRPIRPTASKRFLLVVVGLFVVLSFGGFLGWYLLSWKEKGTENSTQVSDVCSKDKSSQSLMVRARENVFYVSNMALFASVVGEIKSLDGYENDANCLYPLIVYYQMNQNYQLAKEALDSFLKTSKNSNGFDAEFYQLDSVERLEDAINEGLESTKRQNEVGSSSYFMPASGPDNKVGGGE